MKKLALDKIGVKTKRNKVPNNIIGVDTCVDTHVTLKAVYDPYHQN